MPNYTNLIDGIVVMEIYEEPSRLNYLLSFGTILHLLFGTLCLIFIYRKSCKNRKLTTFDFISLASVSLIVMYPLYIVAFWQRYNWVNDNLGISWIVLYSLELAIQRLPIFILIVLALKRSGHLQKSTKRKTTKGNSSRYVGLNLD